MIKQTEPLIQPIDSPVIEPIKVTITESWSIAEVEHKWRLLERSARSNSYLSWSWISAWLSLCDDPPIYVEAVKDGAVVGMGLLSKTTVKLLPGVAIKRLWLHRTGCNTADQIWIEHNDFLLDEKHQSSARRLMIRHLQYYAGFDELYIGLVSESVSSSIERFCSNLRCDLDVPSYRVDLIGIQHSGDYLKTLSRNTRAQINRSRRLLEDKCGPVSLSIAETDEDKAQYLQDIAVLHKQRWGESEYGSGFDNNQFERFHHQLITSDVNNQLTRLYCLQAGPRVFGYIYLLLDQNEWKFYLSALHLHEDNRIKIGLLFHSLVIEQAIAAGMNAYDFLAGKARYKQSLCNVEERQYMLCLYNPSPLVRFRELLRSWKRSYLKNRYYLRDDV